MLDQAHPGPQGDAGLPPKPTALRVARLRAAHQFLDVPPVFADPLARRILGHAGEEALRRSLAGQDHPLQKGLRCSVAVRARVAEDEWIARRAAGVDQFVILGAGLDTTALRHAGDGRLFEVDLADTQAWKRRCLAEAGIAEPASLTFVPLDFERVSLAQGLALAGFDALRPTFFSWLGVSMYLDEPAVRSTLGFIASLAPGSAVVFDYAVSPELLSPRERAGLERIAARTSAHDEPWKTFLRPDELADELKRMGFSRLRDLGADELNRRYLADRSDGLRKSGVSRIVIALV